MADHAVEYVPREIVERDWDLFRGWLELVPLNNLYTVEHIRAWVAEGLFHVWAVFSLAAGAPALCAVVVTSVQDWPLMRVGRILLCGGEELVHWLGLLPQLEQAMRDSGCERIEVYGRRGWERVLATYDYHPQAVVLTKELY